MNRRAPMHQTYINIHVMTSQIKIQTVNAVSYITPLREGGSLPAVVLADDDEMYVLKFRGAGQGPKALIAELLSGEIARKLGLQTPGIVFAEMDPIMGRSEPDPEIQDLLRFSAGLNLGATFLKNSANFSPIIEPKVSSELASKIVWLDAFVMNVDRTPRNVNMMLHQDEVWVIDHGASFYFHHGWNPKTEYHHSPFAMVRDHVLLRFAEDLENADALAREQLNDDFLQNLAALIPDAWLETNDLFPTANSWREAYLTFLKMRLKSSEIFVTEAKNARAQLV